MMMWRMMMLREEENDDVEDDDFFSGDGQIPRLRPGIRPYELGGV